MSNNKNINEMKLTLRHTKDVTRKTFSTNAFGDMPKGYKAREFRIDRLRSIQGMTKEMIEFLSSVIILKEGNGDGWTSINSKDLGSQHDCSTWITVQESLLECINATLKNS